MHPADKKLQADDSVDDDDKHDQHADVQKRDHGFHDGVQHNLQTWQGKHTLFNGACGMTHKKHTLKKVKQVRQKQSNKLQYVMINVLGTPDTSRSGRNTLNALRALTSRPPGFPAA